LALSEFDLIEKYFIQGGAPDESLILGVGDDCALLQPPPGRELAVTIDTLVEGVHFAAGTDPEGLGHKALAVNLSDLAAMGAEPAWVTLALTLPRSDPAWLEGFSRGFLALASASGVRLVGGDTTRGPLSISVAAHGYVEPGKALRRDGARAGDLVYVTGTIGEGAVALLTQQGRYRPQQGKDDLSLRLQRPTPRIDAGRALVGIATAAIDLSDGLLSDLGHICERSGVGAELDLETIPLSPAVSEYLQQGGAWEQVVTGGDDYELCFTVPSQESDALQALGGELDCRLTPVGRIVSEPGIRCRLADGSELKTSNSGYEHFRDHD
jgi:thiamine-monophosphate kinase